MHRKTNNVKVDCAAAEKYLADIDNGSTITGSMVIDGTMKVNLTVYQSVSTFSTIRSLVVSLYNLAWVERTAKDAADIAKLVGVMKRVARAAKIHLGLKLTEGKVAMPIDRFIKKWQKSYLAVRRKRTYLLIYSLC